METRVEGRAGGKAQVRRTARRSWTKKRQDTFLRTLTASCNVRQACRKSGLSESSVYDHRKKDATFRAAWAAALAEAVERMQMMLMERALHGKTVERRYKDGTVITTVEHSDALALRLIRAHKDSAIAQAAEEDEDEAQALRLRILHKLELFARRKEQEQAKLPPPIDAVIDIAADKACDADVE